MSHFTFRIVLRRAWRCAAPRSVVVSDVRAAGVGRCHIDGHVVAELATGAGTVFNPFVRHGDPVVHRDASRTATGTKREIDPECSPGALRHGVDDVIVEYPWPRPENDDSEG